MAPADGFRENARPEPGYRAYLLRRWQEAGAGPAGEPAWRFSLARAGAQEGKHGFTRLEDPMDFVREELSPCGPPCGRDGLAPAAIL